MDCSCLLEVVRREGTWVIVRIHGEEIKLSPYAARALGTALLELSKPLEEAEDGKMA